MNRNNGYKVTEDYMEQLERAEIKIKQNEIKIVSKPRIVANIIFTILTLPLLGFLGINWIAYFIENYNLKKEIEVERKRIEIIERKITREDKDRERERDVFRER